MISGLITWSWVTCVRCSWSQPWAFRSWATLSQEPRRFCGQKPVSPSRPGPPRWEASSTASPSLAWCWMSKVPEQVTGHESPHKSPSQSLFFPLSSGGKTYDKDHVVIMPESEERPSQQWEIELLWKPVGLLENETGNQSCCSRGHASVMEGSFLNFCKAVNEVTGELKRTTWNFTFLLASALVRKSDVGKKQKWRPRRLVRLQLLGSQLPLEKRTTYWTACK